MREWYIQSYDEIFHFPVIGSIERELEFTELLAKIKERHSATMVCVCGDIFLGVQAHQSPSPAR